MKFFETIEGKTLHLKAGAKIVPAEEFSTLVDAKEVLENVQREADSFRLEQAAEAERLKEEAEIAGFEEGLKRWNDQLAHLEKERILVRKEMEEALVPLAMTAVKKIIGREIEMKPQTVVDIIAASLKSVSHHRKIALFVHKNDLDQIESGRPQLKALFDHLESLTIAARDDIPPGGCIVETEAGIVNIGLEQQFQALESAFRSFVKPRSA